MDGDFHRELGANFALVNGQQAVAHYGDSLAEYKALVETAGVLDLSFRGRLCLTGVDRVRFLHGQVTNDIQRLRFGTGCYAAIVNSKGRMEADLNVYCLQDELLLDFEPGLTPAVITRLEKYIVADDVQAVDVSELYALLSVQGPGAENVVRRLGLFEPIPASRLQFSKQVDSALGELYLANHSRIGSAGFDLFVPVDTLRAVATRLADAVGAEGGRMAGWEAFETARVEAGIPRYAMDMDDTNFPQEAGIEARAVSYQKGCYIGQEVLNRIHTMGHVNRALQGFSFEPDCSGLPTRLDKILLGGKEAGFITSAVHSPLLQRPIALGYLRKQADLPVAQVIVRTSAGELTATVQKLPFAHPYAEPGKRV